MEKKSIMIDYTPSELAYGVFQNLSPMIEEKVKQILQEKKDDESKPLSMEESADWLGVSRSTFHKILSRGELKCISLNPDYPKSKKLFLVADLKEWLDKNKSKTIDELKSLANGTTKEKGQ